MLCSKWLKLDLPRFPSPDGKRIGTQPLLTNEFQVGWQCHVIKIFYKHGKDTVIANYFLVNYYQQSLGVPIFTALGGSNCAYSININRLYVKQRIIIG